MTIATDPKTDTITDSDDGFEKAFEEFAAGKEPPPHPNDEIKPTASEGNGPEVTDPAPAPAATGNGASETATSDDADPEGGSQPPEGDKAPDPWENAPPELKAQFEQTQRERDQALHRAQSDASRVAALSRKLNQLSVPPSNAPAPDTKTTEAQAALDDKIKQLRNDYGEIADPLIELFESQKQELAHVKANLTGLTAQQQEQHVAVEVAALETRHPDWRNIASSPDFAGWLEVQPNNIQSLATSWDARETSVALSLYKAEAMEAMSQRGEVPQGAAPTADAATDARRSQQLDGGRDVRSRPAPAASGPPDDFDAAFKFFEEKRAAKALANSRR